jgi:hypothetical protein
MNTTQTLTRSQVASLKAALTMSKANGFATPGCSGSAYRSLESRGLMVLGIVHCATRAGGGWQKRTYRLTATGRAIAESL